MTMEARLQCGSPPPDNGSLFTSPLDTGSVRVRLPPKAGLATNRGVTPATPSFWALFGTAAARSGLEASAMEQLTNWLGSLPGSPEPCGEVGRAPDRPPRQCRSWQGKPVGNFMIGKQIMKDYVVRRALGVLPSEESHLRTGPIDFVESHWKPTHIREGYFPLRARKVDADLAGPNPLQRVHWAPPGGSARASLEKAARVKVDPGIRKVSEAPAGARLRQRARWVLSLNPDKARLWLGGLLSGRWTPDLSAEFAHPSAAALVAARGGVTKFLGGGTLKQTIGEGQEKRTVEHAYVNAVHGGTCFRLFPELLARLATYATFRRRGPTLVSALRTRAIEWAKRQGFTAEVTADMIGPTVALAYLPSAQEIVGQEILGGASTDGSLPEAHGWWASDA